MESSMYDREKQKKAYELMILSTKKINKLLLVVSAAIFIFCGFQLLVMDKVYPYVFIGLMAILTFSSFLAISYLDSVFPPKLILYALIAAILNSALLLSFSFSPSLLRLMWNFSFGLVFLFPVLFILHFVYNRNTKLDKAVYYTTIFTTVFFEFTILFKFSSGWIYDILTATFLLETILLVTLSVFRLNRGVSSGQ